MVRVRDQRQRQSQSQSQSSLSVSVYVLLHIRTPTPTALFQAALLTAPFNLTVYWNVLNGNGWQAGLSEKVELELSWGWGELLSVSVVTCCCCCCRPTCLRRQGRLDLIVIVASMYNCLFVFDCQLTRLSYSDLYSWQWQLMAAIPIPLRSQRIVLAVLGIGRSLYDMEMNAMQAIYSDGGTFIDASTTSAPSICSVQPDVRSFVPPGYHHI